jgi:poly-gamma-glutamate synthesis protein (capsule biosynthesis protein)
MKIFAYRPGRALLAAALTTVLIMTASAPVMAETPGAAPKLRPEPVELTLSFAGDTTLGNNAGKSFFADTYRDKGAKWFLGGVKKIFAEDDLTIVNLEGALTDNKTHINKSGNPVFYFRGDPGYTKILTEGSVEVCNLANNHSRDYGAKGYEDTKKALKKAGVSHYGDGEVTVRTVKGVKIGFVGVQFTSSKSEITSQIRKAKQKGAEVVIFTSHDGAEGSYKPTDRQRAAAKAAISAGADAVLFHHPHVIQGTEKYKGKFIAWSLGNFCFGGNSNPADKDSMIVQLRITKTGEKISITPEVIPARLSSHDGYNDLRPKRAEGKTKSRIEKKIKEISGDYL